VVNGEPELGTVATRLPPLSAFANRPNVLAKRWKRIGTNTLSVTHRKSPGRQSGEKPLPVRSPAGDLGAVFGRARRLGRALYYARPDDPAAPSVVRRPHWHRAVARECAAAANVSRRWICRAWRSSRIEGAGAAAWLDHLIAGRRATRRVARRSTIAARRAGAIVSEMHRVASADGRFWLISARPASRHDEHWLHAPPVRSAMVQSSIANVTARYGSLVVVGPRSPRVAGPSHRYGPVK